MKRQATHWKEIFSNWENSLAADLKVYTKESLFFSVVFAPPEIIFSQTCKSTQPKSWKRSPCRSLDLSLSLFYTHTHTHTHTHTLSLPLFSLQLCLKITATFLSSYSDLWVHNSGRLPASLHFFLYCSLQIPAIIAWCFRTHFACPLRVHNSALPVA